MTRSIRTGAAAALGALLAATGVAQAEERRAGLVYAAPLNCSATFSETGPGAAVGRLTVSCNSGLGFDVETVFPGPTTGALSFAGRTQTLSGAERATIYSSRRADKLSGEVVLSGVSAASVRFVIKPRI